MTLDPHERESIAAALEFTAKSHGYDATLARVAGKEKLAARHLDSARHFRDLAQRFRFEPAENGQV